MSGLGLVESGGCSGLRWCENVGAGSGGNLGDVGA